MNKKGKGIMKMGRQADFMPKGKNLPKAKKTVANYHAKRGR